MDFSPVERQRNGGAQPEAGRGRERSEPGNHRGLPAVLRTAPPRHFVPLPHSANRFVGEKSSAPAAGPVQHLSPVERQRNGGAPPEAGRGRERSEPGNHRGFPAVLRTAPPRHFVPLPHSANRFVGEKSSAPAAGPSNTSPPWSGSGTGEHRRRRGGGASEASQETTVISLRSSGPRPLGTSCYSPTPLTASWGRNPLPQRQGRPTPLPRGAAAERGSTAGGGEGARAKRARKPP